MKIGSILQVLAEEKVYSFLLEEQNYTKAVVNIFIPIGIYIVVSEITKDIFVIYGNNKKYFIRNDNTTKNYIKLL